MNNKYIWHDIQNKNITFVEEYNIGFGTGTFNSEPIWYAYYGSSTSKYTYYIFVEINENEYNFLISKLNNKKEAEDIIKDYIKTHKEIDNGWDIL